MANFVMLRRGRNTLSSVMHVLLNLALAAGVTILTVVSGNCILGILLVLLSKWRIVAVRPRYWWLNLKANAVDLVVGLGIVCLLYTAGVDGLNVLHAILTVFYAFWLIVIKPHSEVIWMEIQALFAIFFGSFALSVMGAQVDPIFCVICAFVIGYSASRHVLMQSDEDDFTFSSFVIGLILAEVSWIFYHWSIVYSFKFMDVTCIIPQLPIVASIAFFLIARGYKSAALHDGKIRADDILVPAVFSAFIMIIMVFFYSAANFNI